MNVKNWVNQECVDCDVLKHIKDTPQLEIYQSSINDKQKELKQLKDLIYDISTQVGFNVGSSMLSEIEEYSKKLEGIQENLISQINDVDIYNNRQAENRIVLTSTNNLIDQLQQNMKQQQLNADMNDKITHLREYMISLSATETRLKQVVSDKQGYKKGEENNNFRSLHTLSQSLLQDTFQQYQDMLQQMVLKCNDSSILQFWQDYINFAQTFLAQDIPCDDVRLQQLRDQYVLISYLLKNFKATLMAKSTIDVNLAEKYKNVDQQHIDCLDMIDDTITQINIRLQHWDNLKTIESSLKQSITNVEREKYTLQLEYINLKELPQLLAKVNRLQQQIPHLETNLNDLNQEMNQIISYSSDENTIIRLMNDHGKLSHQFLKLKENVEIWEKFLAGIVELNTSFEVQFSHIEQNLSELSECLDNLKLDNIGASQHHLNMLKNEQLRLANLKDELLNINKAKDNLKLCISMFDAKLIHKRVWTLWQFFEKLEYSISVLLRQMQERLQNCKIFSHQYNVLITWITEFEKRINDSNKYQVCEDDPMFIKSVEEMLLQEMSLKDSEVDWLNTIGNDLSNNLQEGEERTEIASKLEYLNDAWKNLSRLCQDRKQKIAEIGVTTVSLQRRINEIKIWMACTEQELKKPFVFENMEKINLDKLLDEYEKLQRSIESNSSNVAEVLNLCEMLFVDVESWNVHVDRKLIYHDINNLEVRWKNICLESSKRKQDLLSIWNILIEIQKISDSHKSWVDQFDKYLTNLEEREDTINIEDMGEIFEEIAIKNADIVAQDPILHILRSLFFSLNKQKRIDGHNINSVTYKSKRMLSQWESLLVRSKQVKIKLEKIRTMYSIFNSEYESIIMALTQIDVQVTNIKHLSKPTEHTPETNLKRLRDLHNELRFIINLFDKQDEIGSSLIELLTSNDELSQNIQGKIQEYHQLANNIKQSLDALLATTIEQSEKQKIQPRTEDSAVQVNTLPSLSIRSKSITAREAYQYQLQSALAEAKLHLDYLQKAISEINVNNFMTSTQKVSKASAACESSIELIKHLNIMMLSECQSNDDEAMSKTVNYECERYLTYLTEWRIKQQKLEELSNDDYLTCPLCTNRNWQQIDNDLWRLEQWLLMAEATQKNQHSNPPTDIDTLEDTIQDHREFLLDLDSHKSIIKSLNIVGEHLATHTLDTEKAVKLRERLQTDNQRWDKVCNTASHWQSQLHRALMENKEFHRTVTELCSWLKQTEDKIKNSEPIDLTTDKTLIERKYKTFRELRSELVRCEPRVVSLQETTSQLTKYLEENKSQNFEEIYAKLTDLRLRFHSIRRLVEMYTIKIGAAIGHDPTMDTNSLLSSDSRQEIQGGSGSLIYLTAQESNANAQEEEDENHINTTILTRSYRFLGRVLRASLPIQAMLLLLLGVATLMPHGEDYSCSLTNNFARSLEPMLRYPNGPPPI